MLVRSVLLGLAVLAAPAIAQQTSAPAASSSAAPSRAARLAAAPSLEGAWGLKIDEVVILAFHLERTPSGWSGRWLRPRTFATDGALFTRIEGPPTAVRASKVQALGEWTELTFNDPRPGAVPDVFRLRPRPEGKVEAIYVGTGFAPFVLEKLANDARIGPWPSGRSYQRPGINAAPGASIVTFSIPAPPAAVAPSNADPTLRPPASAPAQGPPAIEGR